MIQTRGSSAGEVTAEEPSSVGRLGLFLEVGVRNRGGSSEVEHSPLARLRPWLGFPPPPRETAKGPQALLRNPFLFIVRDAAM